MAPAAPIELGHNAVAVAIDKGKNSQQAVRWAIDHFMKGNKTPMSVVLIHVKTHNYNPQADTATATTPSESEVQQLFLPYRGFCSRKGIDAMEVVLHDIDVASALVSYIEGNNIGNIVVGASNRNAITRRFKSTDVPTSLEKSAPDFCAVYVIYKGKVQTMRPSNVCLIPSAANTPSSRSSVTSGGSSTYWTTHSKNSFSGSSISGSSTSSVAQSERYYSSSSGGSNPRISYGSDSSSNVHNHNRRSSDGYNNPKAPMGDSPRGSSYNVRRSDGNYGNPNMQMGESPRHSPYNSRRSDGMSNDSPGHSPYNSRSSDGYSGYSNQSPNRMIGMGPPPTHPYSNSSTDYNSRNSSETYSSSNSSTPSRYNQGQNPYNGSNQSSYQSTSNVSIDNNDQSTRASTNSNSFSEELDAEMTRLKIEIKNTMEVYQSICEQASVAKQQADSLQSGDDDDIEEIKLAREAAMVVADLERLKCQAAIDAAQMTERLVEMEGRKRMIIEQKAARREEEERRGRKASAISYRVYSLKDIEIGTDYFSTSLKIGEGGYGPVYRAMLQHTRVAIKVLRPDVSEGLKQFQQEIEVLGRMRHPHMVLLVGACPEYGCLVYEYMENGSLEDRLYRKNNTPPIPWKIRFKIAAEIGTALLFLHDAKPEPMVHRDLKPANILLDANYTSKIGDVGLARLVPATVANQMTQYHMTAAAGTFCYIDPEYQQTGQLGTKSDIYSLGVILLQLITARPPMALSFHVEEAIDAGTFHHILDPSVSDWPFQESLALAQLALKCCELRKKDRPDLDSVILPELIRLRDLAFSS
ncbi:U-box domain-containing protein 35-like [Amaranthus tricolor]|uniref:U-box domain-containing protein 35-like n=1 Tax=Amaranthus tricolor TaxID=29722 RepID=UPI00258CFF79|nr:U-box domain-containing protein 35-like [Amaranthus tricolor]